VQNQEEAVQERIPQNQGARFKKTRIRSKAQQNKQAESSRHKIVASW